MWCAWLAMLGAAAALSTAEAVGVVADIVPTDSLYRYGASQHSGSRFSPLQLNGKARIPNYDVRDYYYTPPLAGQQHTKRPSEILEDLLGRLQKERGLRDRLKWFKD